MSEKLLALGGLLVVAIVGFGWAIYYAHRNGQSTQRIFNEGVFNNSFMGVGMFQSVLLLTLGTK